jgi:cell division protein FtsQ
MISVPRRRGRWVRRYGFIGGLAFIAIALAVGNFTGIVNKFEDNIFDHYYRATAALGFRVADITLSGRQFTSREDVMAALDLHQGDPILAFDPAAAREALQSLPRIASAEVERRLPGTINVRITERAPMAIWQHDQKMALIDSDGVVLGEQVADYPNLPMVVGTGAAGAAGSILAMLEKEPALAKRVTAYIYVGERRWNLRLDNNVEVRLPEADTAAAVHHLATLEADSGLLERDVVAVDLRLPGKIVVETGQPRDPKHKQAPQQGI